MRRSPISLCALVLALVTAVALLRLGEFLSVAPLRGEIAPDGNAALVRRFYDAVNTTLATGQTADLERVLAIALVVHGGPLGRPPTRDGFVQHLLSLHVAYPTMWLSSAVVDRGDVVVADVRVEGATAGAFLQLPLTGQPAPWGTVDLFRITADTIAEYWGGHERAAVLEPLRSASLEVPSPARQIVSVGRTTLAAGGRVDVWTIAGPEAIFLETGHLEVTVSAVRPSPQSGAGSPAPVAPGTDTLIPGDLVLLPKDTPAAIRNDDGPPATFLVIALRNPAVATGSGPAGLPGVDYPAVTATELAGTRQTALPSGPAVLGLGRATIAPGAVFPVATPGAALFVVEAGDLSLARTNGTVWSRRFGAITTATDGTFRPGDAVTIGPGASGELRNAGTTPLVLLVVTITPVDPTAA